MLLVKTPRVYINEPDAISNAGEHVARIGKKPLIIGGKNALNAVQDRLLESFDAEGIDTSNVHIFSGFPSENQFTRYSELATASGADLIIGIGGGRALDTAKAVGDNLKLPVVAIPTIAATCAAWAALTVQYDDEGAFVQMRPLERSPELIIADTKILITSPRRYLYSGVVDTFAKLYETRPSLQKHPDNISMNISVYGSKIAFDRLEENVSKAIAESEKGVYGKAAKDVVDAIIYLAGFAGSFQNDIPHYGFAHPFYHVSTRLANTRIKLHGEKVAYGIVAQLILEKKPEAEVIETIQLFDKYDTAFTLADLGIQGSVDEDLDFLKKDVREAFPYVEASEEDIKHALLEADRLTKQVLAQKGE